MVCILKPSGVRNCDSRLPLLQQIAFDFTNGQSVRVYYCYEMTLNNNWFHNLQTDSTVLLIVRTSFESQYHIILLYLIYECGHINVPNCKMFIFFTPQFFKHYLLCSFCLHFSPWFANSFQLMSPSICMLMYVTSSLIIGV